MALVLGPRVQTYCLQIVKNRCFLLVNEVFDVQILYREVNRVAYFLLPGESLKVNHKEIRCLGNELLFGGLRFLMAIITGVLIS